MISTTSAAFHAQGVPCAELTCWYCSQQFYTDNLAYATRTKFCRPSHSVRYCEKQIAYAAH